MTRDVDPGLRLGLRNVRTGDHHDVLEHLGSLDARLGQYLLLRLEETGGATRSYGEGVPVSARDRDRMLAILDDPHRQIEALLDWVLDAMRPPTVVDGSGAQANSCWAEVATSASAVQVAALLDATDGFEAGGDSRSGDPLDRTWEFGERSELGDGERLEFAAMAATVWVNEADPATIEVVALGEHRFESTISALLDVLPHAQEVDRDVSSIWEAKDRLSSRGGERDAGRDPMDDPEIAALVAERIASMERDWLDESIPALGGLTPREALEDPTRRPDLLRLLNTMPDSPNGFSAARLRAMLGIDELGNPVY